MDYRKSIRREKIETGVGQFSRWLRPSEELMTMAEAVFHQLWESQMNSQSRMLRH